MIGLDTAREYLWFAVFFTESVASKYWREKCVLNSYLKYFRHYSQTDEVS